MAYITRIEIESLWNGKRHIEWDLRPDVNILSGVNGVGKSTILSRVIKHLTTVSTFDRKDDGVQLTYNRTDGETLHFDVIRSFDSPAVSSDFLNKMTGAQLHSELDFALYQLQRSYLDYQVNLSNRMIELFTSAEPDAQQKAQRMAQEKTHFLDLLDGMFKDTGKHVVRSRNELYFSSHGEEIPPYLLSSGEKQMLIIMLTVLLECRKPYVIFLDEPEVSLHIEWQQRLISLIRDLNPHAQLILTTHSPAVIMDGWGDCVTDVEDIVS